MAAAVKAAVFFVCNIIKINILALKDSFLKASGGGKAADAFLACTCSHADVPNGCCNGRNSGLLLDSGGTLLDELAVNGSYCLNGEAFGKQAVTYMLVELPMHFLTQYADDFGMSCA